MSLRALPKVDRVLAEPALADAKRRLGAAATTELVRRAVAEGRDRVRAGGEAPDAAAVAARAAELAGETLSARATRVINATGVLLHTNLGRAPLAPAAVRALAENAAGYTSVEIDRLTGRRGARGAFAERALAQLSGAEDALVVNNNAAAVLLALAATCAGRAVVVSRGELIEIGGGFRVPEVLARSGARMVEVGTTNRTRLDDYARAIDEHRGEVAAVLRVHQGNFRQSGFVERPELGPLAELAHARGVLLVKDLGGGALIPLDVAGLTREPLARACVAAGADLVCFSTDKVLGGPQGGAIVGRAALVARARKDPLARALRLGRLPLVALEATLALYLEGHADEIPVVAMMGRPASDVRARAQRWRDALAQRGVKADVVELDAVVGGGAFGDERFASAGVALSIDAPPESVLQRLREGDPPVVARVDAGLVVLDARTVLEGEDAALLDAAVRATR